MASKNSVFGKILAVFLVLVIISGSSFLAYNLMSGSMNGMNMSGMNTDTKSSDSSNQKKETKSADTSKKEMDMGEDSSKEMDMGASSGNNKMEMDNSSSTSTTQYSAPVIKAVLLNKDDLEKTLVTLKESIALIKQDPLGVETTQETQTNPQNQENTGQDKTTDANGNTIINVYPQTGSPTTTMPNMGTTYDATKMEQLHTGLYKVSVGMQLLEQLKENLTLQLEHASMKITNPAQYYNSQYLTTLQNKNKLSEALTYINEASSLININPYVSSRGLVYDKEKMGQMHESIDKLAISAVNLNKINDNFSRQSIEFLNLTQTSPTMTNTDMDMNMGGNALSTINLTTVLNALVIVFIVIFILSIFGYISKLLKSTKK